MPKKKKKVIFDKVQADFQTIKTSLKSIVRNKEFMDELKELAHRITKIQNDCILFLNSYIRYKFISYQDVPIIDYTLIRYIYKVIGVYSKIIKVKNQDLLDPLTNFYNEHYQPLTNHQKNDLYLLSYMLNSYLCDQILVNINVNIGEHYIQRLTKYIKIFGGQVYDRSELNPNEKKSILNKLVQDIIHYRQIDPIFQEFYNKEFTDGCIIPKENPKYGLINDCKYHPENYLVQSMNMLESYEIFNNQIEIQITNVTDDPFYPKWTKAREELKLLKGKLAKEKKTEIRKLGKQSGTVKLIEQKIKLFAILPQPSSNLKSVPLDTSSLISLFVEEEEKGETRKNFQSLKYKLWNQHFKLDKYPMKGHGNFKFNYMIWTDGTSCSIILNNIKVLSKTERKLITKKIKGQFPYITDLPENQINEYKNRVYIDPGKVHPLYMIDNKNGQKLTYSTKQRQFEIRSDKCSKIMEKEKPIEVKEAENELSQYCSKSILHYDDYLRARSQHEDTLYSFYQRHLWQKWSLRKYMNKQRSEDRFLNKMEQKYSENGKLKDLLVIKGDWSASNKLKNGAPSLGIGSTKMLAKKFHTVLIDEYNTSKICNKCHNKLCKIKDQDGQEIHRVLGCSSFQCYQPRQLKTENNLGDNELKYIHRDLNSVKNMKTIVDSIRTGHGRPKVYCRPTKSLPPRNTVENEGTVVLTVL